MVREEDAAAFVVIAHQALAVQGYEPRITQENIVWLMRSAVLMLGAFGITGPATEENDG